MSKVHRNLGAEHGAFLRVAWAIAHSITTTVVDQGRVGSPNFAGHVLAGVEADPKTQTHTVYSVAKLLTEI